MAGDETVPVILKKSDELTELVAGFKPGDKIRVTGKVRRFTSSPKQNVVSKHYVSADGVELVAPALDSRKAQPRLRPRLCK